jgi:hypothetical protein
MNNFWHDRRYMGRDLNPGSVECEQQVQNNAPGSSAKQRRLSSHQVVSRHVKRRTYFTLANGSPMREIIIQLRSFASSDVAGTIVKL